MARLARRSGVSRFALWIIRGEIEGVSARLQAVLRPSLRRAVRDLRARRDVLVNIGCGPYPLAAFVNVDLRRFSPDTVVWDCRRSLPFAAASCRGIRIEHFVEHVDPRDELPSLLRACHRALAPGGVLADHRAGCAACPPRVCGWRACRVRRAGRAEPVPAGSALARWMSSTIRFTSGTSIAGPTTKKTSRRACSDSGFATTCRARFGESRLPPLAQDRLEHAPYSLYVDAIK